MRRPTIPLAMLTLIATGLSLGCRAHPASLAMMVIGDAVNDADVKQRAEALIGRHVTVADSTFGPRQETLEDARRPGRWLIVYPVRGDLLATSRYVIEASNEIVVALSKTKQYSDGAEDVIREADLRAKLIGQGPAVCRTRGRLGRPALVLHNWQDATLVRVYDVRNVTNLRGARYCVLRFDRDDRCKQVNLVGVSASTRPQ